MIRLPRIAGISFRLILLLSIVLALGAAAKPTAAQNKILLRLQTGDGGAGLQPHNDLLAAFESANPDIQVQLEPINFGDYYARLKTQIAAGSPPDIVQIGDDAVPDFVSNGAMVDLGPYISGKNGIDTSIYLPGLLDPGKYQGKQYFLPKDYSPLIVYYNKKVFDQFKVEYPKDGWTWDDFLKTAQALTKDGTWGVQLPGPWTSGFEYWIAAAGGQLISSDGKTFTGNFDSPAVAKAVQFYGDLYNKYKVAPPPADLQAFGGGNAEFDNGKAAMRIFGYWPKSGMLQNDKIALGVVGLPKGDKRANVLFWGGFGITAASKNKDAAWRLLSFYTSAKAAETWKNWALPAVKSVADASGFDPLDKVFVNELNYLAPRAYTFTDKWGSTADPALRKVLEKVIIDPKTDVAAALAQGAKEAQAALSK
ncbi:MAG: sugar ABC transporter substrate-binding protein [Anaerolineae bacterium]|nr:sugar ABC transporter substrate-binding protein [Anaerolineae bacterium]